MYDYLVNVDIGTTIQLQVSASSQDEAEQFAIQKAEKIILNKPQSVAKNLIVIDAESIIVLQSLETLDKKLIIKGD